ncbi:MAG: hypothetical protein HY077_18165 [Elusimicrobia bacterium]|nr:hypothetical protein [Elusimicrobiota bacterium]
MKKRFAAAVLSIGACAIEALAAGPVTIDFSKDAVGKEPSALACLVGFWQVTKDGGKNVLMVNGGRWSSGQSASNLGDKARALYGERYAEFLDNVKAYAYFPLCVARSVENFSEGEVSFRFKPVSGRIDQGAGIVFNVKPNGDYLILRANALENNLVLFEYVHGRRSSVEWIRNTPTQTGQWQTLKLVVKGKKVQGILNGKTYLEHELAEPVSGKVGVWSKADSVVYFDDFNVRPSR